ncbi:universal stress protein [Streptomyces sp. NPDC008122]|uniref:universal stress protein n=1 Tax=Streptomyces sp. NPDC008122 TaxID=3364810 RepID=UPI0036EF1098
MTAQVVVGLDGSPESIAAAEWAAWAATLREVPLHLVHVDEWPDTPEIPLAFTRGLSDRTEQLLRDTADKARAAHPDLEVTTEQCSGRADQELTACANDADVTVLGSRALGAVVGYLIGSVSLAVTSRARQPCVLVRAGEQTRPAGSIVVGVDVFRSYEPLFAFAFGEAARRNRPLHFLHSWTLPASYGYAAIADPNAGQELGSALAGDLDELLGPWRRRYPGVEVTAKAVVGSAGYQLVEASRDAELVIVGRRERTVPLGPHLGHVAHAVIHHSPAPVAVVPLGDTPSAHDRSG